MNDVTSSTISGENAVAMMDGTDRLRRLEHPDALPAAHGVGQDCTRGVRRKLVKGGEERAKAGEVAGERGRIYRLRVKGEPAAGPLVGALGSSRFG